MTAINLAARGSEAQFEAVVERLWQFLPGWRLLAILRRIAN